MKTVTTIARNVDKFVFFERINVENPYYVVKDLVYEKVRHFQIDASAGWQTERHAYANAARFYNSRVPDTECVKIFPI